MASVARAFLAAVKMSKNIDLCTRLWMVVISSYLAYLKSYIGTKNVGFMVIKLFVSRMCGGFETRNSPNFWVQLKVKPIRADRDLIQSMVLSSSKNWQSTAEFMVARRSASQHMSTGIEQHTSFIPQPPS